jgi:hypothetical protein
MAKIRVYEFAKEFGVESKTVMAELEIWASLCGQRHQQLMRPLCADSRKRRSKTEDVWAVRQFTHLTKQIWNQGKTMPIVRPLARLNLIHREARRW